MEIRAANPTKNSPEYPTGLFLHKNLRKHDIRWLRNLRAVCWCRGGALKVRKLTLRVSTGVVSCPPPIFKPSLGRKEKLAEKVGRREIYPPVPPPLCKCERFGAMQTYRNYIFSYLLTFASVKSPSHEKSIILKIRSFFSFKLGLCDFGETLSNARH